MEELFVPKELGQLLKHKGFNEPCQIGIKDNEELHGVGFGFTNYNNNVHDFVLPLYQQVTNWLIDKHKIYIMVYPRDKWNYYVQGIDETISCSGKQFHGEKFKSHYEALDKAIEVALTLIK